MTTILSTRVSTNHTVTSHKKKLLLLFSDEDDHNPLVASLQDDLDPEDQLSIEQTASRHLVRADEDSDEGDSDEGTSVSQRPTVLPLSQSTAVRTSSAKPAKSPSVKPSLHSSDISNGQNSPSISSVSHSRQSSDTFSSSSETKNLRSEPNTPSEVAVSIPGSLSLSDSDSDSDGDLPQVVILKDEDISEEETIVIQKPPAKKKTRSNKSQVRFVICLQFGASPSSFKHT